MNAVLELTRHFQPVHFRRIYAEYNVLGVCGPFLVQNHIVGTDLGGQSDLFEICINLMGKQMMNNFRIRETFSDLSYKQLSK